VTFEAVNRLTTAEQPVVESGPMLIIGFIGLVANISALIVLRPSASGSINMRGAYLEVLGDTLGSVAAIIAATVILTTGFSYADSVASLVIAAMIIPRALLLLRDVFRVLSGGAPLQTDIAEIRRHIRDTPGVVDVHDIHVWSITSGAHVFSAHVVVASDIFRENQTGPLLDRLNECLAGHFDVEHSTFQLEPEEHAEHEPPQHR
jgi:cobalt-zinc-cadmium efflux system protein